MHITFLAHSGFLVETHTCYLLFDWWEGTLPALGDKPLYCFASHSHYDHFNPQIFALPATLIIDSTLTPMGQNPTHVVTGNQQLTVDQLSIQTLPSTDEGVAFVVTVDGATIYHAGDLNWWHWEGEPDPWNPEMEKAFKAAVSPMAGRTIDVAMVPLDGRLAHASGWGLGHLLDIANVKTVIPMHQWDDPAPTRAFVETHPQWAEKLRPLELPGATMDTNSNP